MSRHSLLSFLFFFNDTATTEIYTLSLHDALPIYAGPFPLSPIARAGRVIRRANEKQFHTFDLAKVWNCFSDRKSTRLNSSHVRISYAVFCLKKNKIDNRWPSDCK